VKNLQKKIKDLIAKRIIFNILLANKHILLKKILVIIKTKIINIFTSK